MAFNDLEYHAIKKEIDLFLEAVRPRPSARTALDMVYHIDEQTIIIAETRSAGQNRRRDIQELALAKIAYIRSQERWKLYWNRGDLKWEFYQETSTLNATLNLLLLDKHGCFFG